MMGYFYAIVWTGTVGEWKVLHYQPKMVPPAYHRETGAKTIEARKDEYWVKLDSNNGFGWSSYLPGEALPWKDDFLTKGLLLAAQASGFKDLLELLVEATRRGSIDLKKHSWPLAKEMTPTLWDHLLEA